MKIAHIASEYYPYVKTGGLADVVAALSAGLAGRGHETAVFLPAYRSLRQHPDWADAEKVLSLDIELGADNAAGEVWRLRTVKNLTFYLISREEYFDRSFPYGTTARDYDDNFLRFLFLQKAVLEVLFRLRLKLDILHCHDWQTALLPVLLRWEEQRRGTRIVDRTVLTFHNLAFQGIFPLRFFAATGLPETLQGIHGLEFYGQMNCLKGGLLFADQITTVSRRYAEETLTPAFGCGLEGVLASRKKEFSAIRNGIDDDFWDPTSDPFIPAHFSASDLSGKARCRAALLQEIGWEPDEPKPLFAMICRMTEQKGIDLVYDLVGWFAGEGKGKLILLGSGAADWKRKWEAVARSFPEAVFFRSSMDEAFAHRVEAGADFYLMPSRFEPCGLNQMYSQRYGTIPLVGETGGLVDTVTPLSADFSTGDGWVFPVSRDTLEGALDEAVALYARERTLRKVQKRIMRNDWGWSQVLQEYEEMYQRLLNP